ncbi:hypothetical protein BN7_6519 [Wickerhamomyces ciferrii]|uniref:Transcription factor domain-containing protein n=1 Tax=Wickerhamomyces ciferrii (strain ATCC 14091 / BCRC 22168 / CBS 111 / JCM 3599 / NBRC 0793 / NRRL Y-1031 F-60-10) TaxID=1206466 RepID=K0KZY4_WICCF|nr:uncharacterized protein BN7_6519 [Wickerhamomyces ciferrii]CCH46914.1 hypothetical protein BN7_6519 [Wickerhamomyces ciferrii]
MDNDSNKNELKGINVQIPVLPCMDGHNDPKANKKNKKCPQGHDSTSCGFVKDGRIDSLPCNKRPKDPIDIDSFNVKYESKDHHHNHNHSHNETDSNYLDQNFDVSSIISNYYSNFHCSHPFLPPLIDIEDYLKFANYPKELLAAMKLMGDGYSTSTYSKNINNIFDIVVEINSYIESFEKDLISLQTMTLLALICHISALHELSRSLRIKCINLATHLDINNLDLNDFKNDFDINGNEIPKNNEDSSDNEININFQNTKRIRSIDEEMLKDCARRCFWDIFFLDIIMGCSDGKTVSVLTSLNCFVNYPNHPDKFEFDYETRASTSKLVDDSVRLNNIIFSNSSIGNHYIKLTASLSNWELRFSKPDFYKLPYLVDGMGRVNNGIHQGIIMLNYAKIFTHRPLSFLWRPDIPKNLKSVELFNNHLNNEERNVPNDKNLIKSRKIIETRKTIDAANSIAKTLIDTNPLDITKRTPLSTCSLAFAGLVHLSSYVWYSQITQSKNDDQNLGSFNTNDLKIFEEYLKLELSGIYQISQHWYLSSKIATYLLDSITKLLPDLSKKLHSHFHNEIMFSNSKPKEDEFEASRKIESTNFNNLSLKKNSNKSSNQSTNNNQSNESSNTNTNMSSNSDILTPSNTTISSEPQLKEDSLSLPPTDINNILNHDPIPQFNTPIMEWPTNLPNSSTNQDSLLNFEPISPQSDTGCEWVDKNQLDFDFSNFDFGEFDLNTINAIDDMIRNATS